MKKSYLSIVGWDTFQTYRKDRGTPPWIKVHRSMLTSQRWLSLTDAEKGALVSIWVVASAKNGLVPADPTILMRMAQLEIEPNINKYIDLNYIVADGLPDGCQSDLLDTDTEAEADTEAEPGCQISNQSWKEKAFEEDWENYPRKAGSKKKAKACYLKTISTQKRREAFQWKTFLYVKSVKDPAFLKHGETWFRNWVEHIVDNAPKPQTKTGMKLDIIKNYGGSNGNRKIISDSDGDAGPLRIESGGGNSVSDVEEFGK
jgi:hypothetical protein